MLIPPAHSNPARRALHRFWLLLMVAVLATGALGSALGAAPGPLTGLSVAVSGVVLLGSLAAAARIMIAMERARKRTIDANDHH